MFAPVPVSVALLAALLSFALYALTASPALGWLDAPELVAAAVTLGVPHSPGHPLAVLAGCLGALLPIGDLVLRVSLVSAAASAGAAAFLAVAARRLLDRLAPSLPRAARAIAALAMALIYALSWAAWFQAVRAEVYALEALLHGAVLALALDALSREEPAAGHARGLYAGALIAGLALATHPFIALVVIAPAAAAVLVWQRPGWSRCARLALLGLLGLAALLQTPVRAARYPLVNWGAPHTAERFVWTVSARAFHKSTVEEHASPPAEDLAQTLAAVMDQATWLMALAALLGLYAGLRRSGPARRASAVLGAMLALGIAGRVVIGFDPETPDHHAYLLPALAALLLLGLLGLAVLAETLARAGRARAGGVLLAAALTLLVPWQLARFLPQASLAGARASDAMAGWQLDGLPPRALLLSAYFETRFRLWALAAVEGARPDVDVLDRSFLTYPGMAEDARRAHPALAPLIDAPLRAGAPLPVDLLRDLARARPVRVELHPNLEPEADPWLLPAGPFAALVPDAPGEAARALAEGRDRLAAVELARRLGEGAGPAAVPEAEAVRVRGAVLWHHFTRLIFFCRQGRLQAAQQTLDHTWTLAPGDATLRDLAAGCGLRSPEPAP